MNDTDAYIAMFLCEAGAVNATRRDSGPLKFFAWGGKTFASGLGVAHAQEGVPMAFLLDQFAVRGITPSLRDAEYELVRAGCADTSARKKVLSQVQDMVEPIPEAWRVVPSNREYLSP